MEVGELFIIFRVMQVDVSFAGCAVALSCASLIGNLVFFIPMQVGSREAGMALALGWMGLAPSVSITASLLTRMREIFYLAVGVGALLLTGGSPRTRKPPLLLKTNRLPLMAKPLPPMMLPTRKSPIPPPPAKARRPHERGADSFRRRRPPLRQRAAQAIPQNRRAHGDRIRAGRRCEREARRPRDGRGRGLSAAARAGRALRLRPRARRRGAQRNPAAWSGTR